jgi:hypothetical protein
MEKQSVFVFGAIEAGVAYREVCNAIPALGKRGLPPQSEFAGYEVAEPSDAQSPDNFYHQA